VVPLGESVYALREYPRFVAEWRQYARSAGAEKLRLRDAYPCLLDRRPTTPYDPHYFHQAVWATKRILAGAPQEHVDVGSDVNFVGTLSASIPVVFVDLRPLPIELENFRPIQGDLAGRLPFPSASQASISCLHVAEHVGLGRYGDDVAADGTKRACAELTRVLAPGGNLFFSLPVGVPRVCFNAHRIHSPQQILDYFASLELVEFSVVGDDYRFQSGADPQDAARLDYGCGLFWFRGRA
jgi:SAM-dependent methyltransferase